MLSKNSWVLSVKNKEATKYYHHYFCTCSKEFKLQTEIDEPYAPDILCPICGNDYFKDAIAFENITSTKIWKYFQWMTILSEDNDSWDILFRYEVPIYNDVLHEVKLVNKDLLHIRLKKDGSVPFKSTYKSKIIFRYSLFLDDKVQAFKQLLADSIKENLYDYVMRNRNKAIEWIEYSEIEEFLIDDKLKYLTFFLKNAHLKEHRFFFWKMDNIQKYTIEHATQMQMLDFIADNRTQKSIKKALYQGYENSINRIGYYPYSDYIFSRSIKNIDLLVRFYAIHPDIKKLIFTDETFFVAIEFILFLKGHYTEKQIGKLFIKDMQDVKEYKSRINNWIDTLRMLQRVNIFNALKKHFIKTKLTTKKLHDEILRVSHIVTYELDSKEIFDYDKKYLSACSIYEELEFKLPSTVKELSLWAKSLHNCMFGYSRKIHQQSSIIYGVFRAEELLYAVELRNLKIIQAKAVSNSVVPSEDIKIINNWLNTKLIAM